MRATTGNKRGGTLHDERRHRDGKGEDGREGGAGPAQSGLLNNVQKALGKAKVGGAAHDPYEKPRTLAEVQSFLQSLPGGKDVRVQGAIKVVGGPLGEKGAVVSVQWPFEMSFLEWAEWVDRQEWES